MPPKRQKGKQAVEKQDEELSIKPSAMKVAQLKEELTKRGLDATGKKAELVSRLESATAGSSASKVAKVEPEEEETDDGKSTFSKAVSELKKSAPAKKSQHKVDTHYSLHSYYDVVDDWDCMLNQTNIGHNNNKFYVIQLLKQKVLPEYKVWTRWGRVGEVGSSADKHCTTMNDAIKEFKKKFKDKTKNDWDKRSNFVPQPGKYTLIDMGDEDEDDEGAMEMEETDAPAAKVKECSLDKSTQGLVKLLFDTDMFRESMQSLEIDTKKMPLGKLSKPQIAKGFQALEEIEEALKNKAGNAKLSELSSKFYTIIPHDFGRRVPQVINNAELLQKKFDMLVVLGDIEMAQTMQKDKKPTAAEVDEVVPHPLDTNYSLLKCDLKYLDKTDKEYDVVKKYFEATSPQWNKMELTGVWRMDREGSSERFSEHESLGNRKLLWHGTNVAVVAAILKSGLRIMPHSGGRVGRGIYFASENSKSAGYVRSVMQQGIMFLGEVALGKEYGITRDDSSLVKAPKGYDCVVARGRTEPDSKFDTTVTLDCKTVQVPQGKPLSRSEFESSYFQQSEYLIYKESQVKLRYLLKFKFGGYHW